MKENILFESAEMAATALMAALASLAIYIYNQEFRTTRISSLTLVRTRNSCKVKVQQLKENLLIL